MGRKSTFRFHNANGRIRLEISADEEDFNGMTVEFEKRDEVKESEEEKEEEEESLIMTGLERITKRQRVNIEVPTRSESTERKMKVKKLWKTHTPVDFDDPPTVYDFPWEESVEGHGEGEKEIEHDEEKKEEHENDEDVKEGMEERKMKIKKLWKSQIPADVVDPPSLLDFSLDENVEGQGEKEEQKENEKIEEKEELKEKGKKENDEDEKEEQKERKEGKKEMKKKEKKENDEDEKEKMKERKERKKERKKTLPAKEITTSPIARRTRGRLAKKTKTKKNK